MNNTKEKKINAPFMFYFIGLLLFIVACVVGYLLYSKSATVDPAYLAKYLNNPSLYPLKDAPMVKDSLYLVISIATGIFLCSVCYAFAIIIDLLEDIKDNRVSLSSQACKTLDVAFCPNCGEKLN